MWDWGPEREILVQIESGQQEREPPERYSGRLDVDQTGTLQITDLRPEDSGIYTGQIINGDGIVRHVYYNVIVFKAAPLKNLEPVVTTVPDGCPSTAAHRHWTLVGFVFFLMLYFLFLNY